MRGFAAISSYVVGKKYKEYYKSQQLMRLKTLYKYMCSLPDKNISPTLYEHVIKYQTHKHNSYCLWKKKTKSGFITVSRFGFPCQITESLRIRNVTEPIATRKMLTSNNRLYNILCKEESRYLNDYNSTILLVWKEQL